MNTAENNVQRDAAPAIEVRELVKRYADKLALDYLNMNVRTGEIYGLLGPNGSGKTTAINCILGLLTYDSGQIRAFGGKMGPTAYDLKRRIGVVPQDVAVFNELTVQENIEYFCSLYVADKMRRARLVDEAIEFVGLEDYRKIPPAQALRRSAAPIEHCMRHSAPTRTHLLRRADGGGGSAKPQLDSRRHQTAQRAWRDRRVHEPLHGGGRADLRPHPDHRSRPSDRHRHGRRAQAHDRGRRANHRRSAGVERE